MEPPLSQEDPPPQKRESGLGAELQYFSPVEGCFKNLLKEPIKILSAFIWPLGETIQRCTWQYTFVTHLAVLFIPLLLRLQSQEAPLLLPSRQPAPLSHRPCRPAGAWLPPLNPFFAWLPLHFPPKLLDVVGKGSRSSHFSQLTRTEISWVSGGGGSSRRGGREQLHSLEKGSSSLQ